MTLTHQKYANLQHLLSQRLHSKSIANPGKYHNKGLCQIISVSCLRYCVNLTWKLTKACLYWFMSGVRRDAGTVWFYFYKHCLLCQMKRNPSETFTLKKKDKQIANNILNLNKKTWNKLRSWGGIDFCFQCLLHNVHVASSLVWKWWLAVRKWLFHGCFTMCAVSSCSSLETLDTHTKKSPASFNMFSVLKLNVKLKWK